MILINDSKLNGHLRPTYRLTRTEAGLFVLILAYCKDKSNPFAYILGACKSFQRKTGFQNNLAEKIFNVANKVACTDQVMLQYCGYRFEGAFSRFILETKGTIAFPIKYSLLIIIH